ncbi:HAMP domain-containing histidine kinase [Acetobacterium wieringae]|uniref:histidine kinase n=1 Tax=Acetobacterium wieringae TaxID=52694 RepID=A0ABY6HEW1_9FIRM|nr:HAMP domain-containing sensor histidine kinase [Acetobacterium wieringae]UYO62958.1 HAMP domain-containing histidine kinase [Acetobacterium wieringae]VUZ26880.1 Adaptive-response sensory-kinase SasA [Acetobacterium wieringae]
MIKKLKRRFVATIMIILSLVFALILGSINYFNYQSSERQSISLLSVLADNDGVIPPATPVTPGAANPLPPDIFEREKTYSVKVNAATNLFTINGSSDTSQVSQEVLDLANQMLEKNRSSGALNGYRYLVVDKPYGQLLVFVDQRISNAMADRLLTTSLIIGSITLLVLFFVSLFLANLMVKPVADAFEKQKRFISDASHELKTPLSVISVNADVLAGDIGTNRHLGYIQSETDRMNTLVNDLLTLARLDADKTLGVTSTFDLSHAIESIALSFESIAFEAHKNYILKIEDGITYQGDAHQIKQVAAILIDNAIKHANEDGQIELTLKRSGDKIHLDVFNTGAGIPYDQRDKIFERFYRYDESRSKATGGYGLGLAIAQAIVSEHQGKIKVNSEVGRWAWFSVIL